jgi:hypothetical protein
LEVIVEVVGIALVHVEAAAIQMSFHGHNPRCPGTDTHFSKIFPTAVTAHVKLPNYFCLNLRPLSHLKCD